VGVRLCRGGRFLKEGQRPGAVHTVEPRTTSKVVNRILEMSGERGTLIRGDGCCRHSVYQRLHHSLQFVRFVPIGVVNTGLSFGVRYLMIDCI
jgi:hypothetical protein